MNSTRPALLHPGGPRLIALPSSSDPPSLLISNAWTWEKVEKNRKCTDVLFAIVFFAFTIGMLAIAGLGFSTGDPAVLIYGTDYTGNLCTEDYPARYFPNPYEMAFFIESQTNPLVTYEFTDVKSICLKDCPANDAPNALNWVCNYPDDGDDTFASVPSLTRAEWAAQSPYVPSRGHSSREVSTSSRPTPPSAPAFRIRIRGNSSSTRWRSP